MYLIRFHGRGGQGMKTAAHILGTAFFREGFQVQDAPRYGAERRGAPIFAYVRASATAVYERGIIHRPDLVIVADSSLLAIPTAGVLSGVTDQTVLLINGREGPKFWEEKLDFPGTLQMLHPEEVLETPVVDPLEQRFVGVRCVGAAVRLLGVISTKALEEAILEEVGHLGVDVVQTNLEKARQGYESMATYEGSVVESGGSPVRGYRNPDWVDLPFEEARTSAPAIHAEATSLNVKTGLWRTMRPVLDHNICHRCWWVCRTYCPDGTIEVSEEGYPQFDYDYCKGCMICLTECPWHAIYAVPEAEETVELAEMVQA
jgi:pyruvate ferredoxin oxidoreductase gamma subunit